MHEQQTLKSLIVRAVKTKNYEFGFLSKFEALGFLSTSNIGTAVVFDDATARFVHSKEPQKIYGAEVSADLTLLNDNLQFGASYSYVEGLVSYNPYDLRGCYCSSQSNSLCQH